MNIKPKEKFIVKQELKNYNINYDADNSLLKPIFNSKMNKDLNPTNFYYSNQSIGAGRGFGNYDIANDMHFGKSSRDDNIEWKQYKEGVTIDRFEFIDNNIQNPKHLVMDIPRGGLSTRKQLNTDNDIDKKITFNY